MTCGIFSITDENDKIYIGRSKDIERRIEEDSLGAELGCFQWEILEECSPDNLIKVKEKWVKKLGAQGNHIEYLENAIEHDFFPQEETSNFLNSEYLCLDNMDIQVLDDGEWTPIRGILRDNEADSLDFLNIEYIAANNEKKVFKCTVDHPLVINKERVEAHELNIGDFLTDTKGNQCLITNIEQIPTRSVSYDLETDTDTFDCSGIRSHNCRTLTLGDNLVECDCFQEPENYHYERNIRPPYSTTFGKGNFAFVTINLPHLALQASKDVRKESKISLLAQKEKALPGFYNYLFEMIIESKNILLHKRSIMNKKTGDNFSFVVGQHMITNTQNVGPHDKTEDIWKHFSLSIGYIGIYEVLRILYGKKQIEVNEKGIEIVSIIRTVCDTFSKGYYLKPKKENWWKTYVEDVKNGNLEDYDIYNLKDEKIEEIPTNVRENFACFSTPAEGLCNTSCKTDLKTFGTVKNITDKEYYTNSHHIDVREPVSFKEKAELEAPYHELCNAGTIFYVEADSVMHHNPKAYKEILNTMKDNDLSYCAINVPLDECGVCHSRGEFEEGKGCPYCGAGEEMITRVRRITGYLVGDNRLWNNGKRKELKNRVKHTKN